MKKRFLVCLMFISLIIGLVPVQLEKVVAKENEKLNFNKTQSEEDSWEECNSCSKEHPHLISTPQDLDKIRTHIHTENGVTTITGYFKLTNDIVFKDEDFEEGGAFYNEGYGWITIGKDNGTVSDDSTIKNFLGVLDGKEYAIVNMKTYNQPAYVGLFGKVGSEDNRNAIIRNLTLKNCIFNEKYIVDPNKTCGRSMGGITVNLFGTVSNVMIDRCEFNAVRGYVGAIVAGVNGGTIEGCIVSHSKVNAISTPDGGNNNGDKAGLICGIVNADGQISDCTVQDSKVSADSRGVAGIVGMQYGSVIKDCIVQNCEIIGKAECVGGISGGNYAGSWNSFIENCTVIDSIISAARSIGGIEGYVDVGADVTVSLKNNVVSNCLLILNGKNLQFSSNAGGIFAGTFGAKVTIENCVAKKVKIDSTETTLSETSPHTIRLGSICGGANESLKISNVFADVEIIHANSGREKIGGICTDQLTVDQNEVITLTTAPTNTYYLQYNGTPIEDYPHSNSTVYAFNPLLEKTIEYEDNKQIKLNEFLGVTTLPTGDMVKYKSSNESVLSVTDDAVIIHGVGTATITCSVIINQIEKNFVNIPVTVEPMQIIYGPTDKTDPTTGLPYLSYVPENGKEPLLSDMLDFYPVKESNGNLPFEADTDASRINLVPGTDVEYIYESEGQTITTDTLPIRPTTGEDRIRVQLRLKNKNYQFCTMGTEWKPKDTITLFVDVYKEGMKEIKMLIDGKVINMYEELQHYEYTGEGIIPTDKDLTKLTTENDIIKEFTVHFHAVKENAPFVSTHLTGKASELKKEEVKKLAPQELGVYSFVINGSDKDTYSYVSRRYEIVKGTPVGKPIVEKVNREIKLSEVEIKGRMVNAIGKEVEGKYTWNSPETTVEQGEEYTWTFTPKDTEHYETVSGKSIVWEEEKEPEVPVAPEQPEGPDENIDIEQNEEATQPIKEGVKTGDNTPDMKGPVLLMIVAGLGMIYFYKKSHRHHSE
ncbi:MAG: right-handed parallel beta-helix repeat-containing protein [Erysipelotrichales bacterium]|nr:right-handed parallel beta-helix repeat-containing protein [Erysipelotrichales bacterium]